MADVTWTDSQRQATRETGRSVLVSAGAGSGKTAVLAERCVHLITDAQPASQIDRLLVVTFTEAAAAQMRDRIGQALRARLDQDGNDGKIRRQLAMLDGAAISTIHAFCRRILDRFFAQAGCDPAAALMDAHDAAILRQECAEEVFREFGDRKDAEGERFHAFVQAYGAGRDSALIELILGLDAFLESLPDPNGWLGTAKAQLINKTEGSLPAEWKAMLVERLIEELDEQIEHVERAEVDLAQRGSIAKPFVDCLEEYRALLESWRKPLGPRVSTSKIDAACAKGIGASEFPTIPALKGDAAKLEGAERAEYVACQDVCRTIRKKLFIERLQAPFGRFTCAQWAEGIASISPHVETIVGLVTALRKGYAAAKADLDVMDFSDLERRALDLLRDEDSGVAKRLRDRFDHVLVDEFQDVSPIQAEILRRVSREEDPNRPDNLFEVGDVKQSIYRFRLAEPKLFLDRLARFSRASEDASIVACRFAVQPIPRERKAGRLRPPNDNVAKFGSGDQLPLFDAKPHGCAIDLVENFRSSRPVIDAVNAVFERLMTPDLGGVPYDEHGRLKFGRGDDASEQRSSVGLELHVLEENVGVTPRESTETAAPSDDSKHADAHSDKDSTRSDRPEENENPEDDEHSDKRRDDAGDWERIEREAWLIARRIEALRDEGIAYRDMVILLRSLARRAPLLIRALGRMGVPVHAEVAGGFFDSLEVQDVLALLALLDNAQQDIPLAAILRGPMLGEPITDSELVEIRTFGTSADRRDRFHAAVLRYSRNGPAGRLRERLEHFYTRLDSWRGLARRRPLADVLWTIYHETGYVAFVQGLTDGAQRRANLIALHDHARTFGTFGRHGLYRFLRFIEQLQDSEQDLEPAAVSTAAADVVRVMSVHRSKGLEFPIVFLAELGKRFNLSESSGTVLFDRAMGFGLKAVDVERRIVYPTLPHRLVAQQVRAEALSEELRVLYVALTRARERLILVGTGKVERLEEYERLYGGHDGPLPAAERRSARCLLDWVAPAVCAVRERSRVVETTRPAQSANVLLLPSTRSKGTHPRDLRDSVESRLNADAATAFTWQGPRLSEGDDLFRIFAYPADTIRTWSMDPPTIPKAREMLDAFSRMEPLPQALRPDSRPPALEIVARRLTTPYRAARLARVPAVAAASELKRRWESGPQVDGEPMCAWSAQGAKGSQESGKPARQIDLARFAWPSFLGGESDDAATRRGTSTHAVLERLDLARPCDAADVRQQLEKLVAAGVLAADEARDVSVDDIAWLMATDLGRRLRGTGVTMHREWPFVIGVDPRRYDPAATAADPGDVLLVRGIIDCLFDAGAGWEILDYKTDRVTGAALDERARLYRGQLSIYSEAVERLWPGKSGKRWLAFLHARVIVEA